MKKILPLIAMALLATQTQGAQIAWTLSNIAFDGSKLKSAGTELTVSLFALGSGGTLASSYSEADIAGLTIAESSSGTNTKSANTGAYTLTVGSDKNGDVFGVLLSYVSSGKTYYNIATTTYTLSGFQDETSAVSELQLAAGDMNYGTASGSPTKVTPGGGWTAVPEPSTAALALAGLALLLKRRRA